MSASVVIQRRVEWPDTDAAGHWHYSALIRWVEAAETVLLERLGLEWLYGSTPRVHFEADFLDRLWFRDVVDVEFRVAEVGRSSLRFAFDVRRGANIATRGAVVTAYIDPAAGAARPWPDEVRETLRGAGPQRPELLDLG